MSVQPPVSSGVVADGRIGFFAHLRLLLRLRLQTEANRHLKLSEALPSALGLLALIGGACAVGLATYALMTVPSIAASPRWSSFILRMLCFLVSAVFVIWPILSAGVDEHSELTRFSTFPIRPFRLFAASSLVALFEPRSFVFYPAIIGAVVGYAAQRPFQPLPAAALIGAYFVLNAAWGRAGLTLMLNVLRHRRSAEILGVAFLLTLFLASLAPPIDARWLYDLFRGGGGDGAVDLVDDRMVIAATRGLAGVPPVALALGVEALAHDRDPLVPMLLRMGIFAALGFALSYYLMVRFYRGIARPAPPRKEPAAGRRVREGALWALIDREASDLIRNPKARLLCAVPFFLCILLHLVRARDLASAALGDSADAWLLTVLCAYGALVVSANFAQNAFAYDGHGLALLYAAPVPLRHVLVAKNLVHASAALLVSLLLTAFYAVYVQPVGLGTALAGILAVLGQLPVLLAAGNLLSVLSPRKFHASLRRRDRPPPGATFGGLVAAAIAVMPSGMLLRWIGEEAPGPLMLTALLGIAAAAWTVWAVMLPKACALLESRKERVLRAVMRE